MKRATRGRWSRRQLLKRAATAAAGLVAAPYAVTSTALGAGGRAAPSDRIAMGFIGTGGRGNVNLRLLIAATDVQVVAVCDADAKARDRTKAVVDARYGNTDCAAYKDFRDVVTRKDIDAVDVSTPDHWHAIPTILAAQHGKDVHVEKPLSLTIREGREMVRAVRRYARVCQTGSEARANPRCRLACELVRNGRIGKVREVYVTGVGGPSSTRILPGEPVPPGLDWDLWLGPAPWRPYNHAYHPFRWRAFHDFSGGGMTDWGAHHFDLAQWALGMDDTGPVEIIPPDGKEHRWLTFRYATGVVMYHVLGRGGGKAPDLLGRGVTLVGTEGRLGVWYGGLEKTDPPGIAREAIGPGDVHLHGCPPGGHERGDFLHAVRTRQKPGADVEIGHRTVSVCHLGNIAYRLRRPLRWDPVRELFPDDPGANRLLDRPKRAPWRL